MQNFHQWLETNHPELNEGFLKNAALAGAMALGTAAPNMAQAAPNQPTVNQDVQNKLDRLHQRQDQRQRLKIPAIATLMGLSAAARAVHQIAKHKVSD